MGGQSQTLLHPHSLLRSPPLPLSISYSPSHTLPLPLILSPLQVTEARSRSDCLVMDVNRLLECIRAGSLSAAEGQKPLMIASFSKGGWVVGWVGRWVGDQCKGGA